MLIQCHTKLHGLVLNFIIYGESRDHNFCDFIQIQSIFFQVAEAHTF